MPRKRSTGQGALYFDAKRKLWIGSIDNGFTPEGKRKQERVTSKSQSTARAKLEKLIQEVKAHDAPLGNQTVAEWGVLWLEMVKAKKPQTYRTYNSILKTWVLPQIGRRKVKEVRPSDLAKVYANIKAAGRASSTALKAHNVMSAMFEQARLERITDRNVAADIRPPKAAKTTRDSLSPAETFNVLEVAKQIPDGSKWVVSLYAGIRQGERLGATLDSVDLDRGTFTVRWNMVEGNYEHGCGGDCGKKAAGHCPEKRLVIPDVTDYRLLKGRLMLVPPKSGEERTFPIPEGLRSMLQDQIDRANSQPNPHGLLWPAEDGSPILPRADQEQWRAMLRAAGIDRPAATTHWARHTAISDMTAGGTADRVIGEMVGHKSPGVTGRYQHVSSQDASEAMDKLEKRRQLES